MLDLRDLKPGVTLGRYEILMPVAQGGMASVWAARMVGSRGFQKIVAIKTMLPHLSDEPEFEAMFLDEARLASRVRHPHVAEILDLGDEEGMLYLVMEWVNGETLFVLNQSAKKKGGFPLPLLLHLMSSICSGLHAAHEMHDEKGQPIGLVHRDVNPANIMVSYDGIVKVVDFGVAKATARVSQTRVTGMLKGKAHYMAPEQVKGEALDRRADIFALGILMYVMISGRHPFKAESEKQTMENIVASDPVSIGDLVPDLRPDLAALVMKALAKNAADRWSDCAEMQRALDQISNAISAAVTDGDLAKFVRSVMGDRSEQRRTELATAIAAADARAALVTDPPASRRRDLGAEGPASRRRPGGAPSSRGASLDGIIPLSLDGDAGSSGETSPLSVRTAVPPLPALPLAPAPLVPPPPRRHVTSLLVLLLIVVVSAIGAVAAMQAGWFSSSAPPPDVVSTPGRPAALPSVRPSSSSVAVAVQDASVDASADADAADAGADVRDGGRIEGDAGWYFENGFWHPPPGWKGGSKTLKHDDPYDGN